MKSKKTSEVKRDYRRYRAIIGDDAGRPADVPADFVDDINDFFG